MDTCCVAAVSACLAGVVALLVRSPHADSQKSLQAENGHSNGEALVQCAHQDASMKVTVSGMRKVTVEGSFVYVFQPNGKVEELVLLDEAKVQVDGAVVSVATKIPSILTLWLDTDEQAQEWARKIQRCASRNHGASNDASSRGETDAERAQQKRIADLEKRVNANLKEATDRARRIKELEAAAKDGSTEQLQHISKLEKMASAAQTQVAAKDRDIVELEQRTQAAKNEAEVKAERVAKLQEELQAAVENNSVEAAAPEVLDDLLARVELLLSSKEIVIDSKSASKLRASAEKVKQSMPTTDARVTNLMVGMASALRVPSALRAKLAAAETAVKEHKELQAETSKQLASLKERFDEERAARERAQTRAGELQAQLASAQLAADEAAEKVRSMEEQSKRDTEELRKQLEVAQKAAEQTAAELEDALASSQGAAKTHVEEVEKQKKEAEEAARKLQFQLQQAQDAADTAISDLHRLQVDSEKEAADLRRELATLYDDDGGLNPTAEQIDSLQKRLEDEAQREREAARKAAKLQEQLATAQEAANRAAAEMAELGAAFEAVKVEFPDHGVGGQAKELEDRLSSAEAALAALDLDLESASRSGSKA